MVNNNLYNEDELHPPEWLDTQFFEKVLKNVEKESVKILDFVISPATTKSDHYASIMFRAKVKYIGPTGERTRSFVLKTNPIQDGFKKEKLEKMDLFNTEIQMFTVTIPRIEAVLRQYGDNTILCPNMVYHILEEPQCAVFEDLVELGYTTISNRNITLDEVKLALLKLSKLHAISYKLAKENDTLVTSFNKGSFNSDDLTQIEFISDAVKLFKEVVTDQPDLHCYLPHIKAVEDDILAKCVATFNAYTDGDRDGICVLNHGDFHMKNMMVLNEEGKLKELMLFDYQISIFGSPAIDLHYAFVMLLSPAMRRDKYDELLYYYISNFQETLKNVEFNGHIPTVLEFRNELQKHRHWGLYMFMSFLMLNYVFSDEKGDLAKAVEDVTYRRALLTNPKLLEELRQLLPRFLHLGYFGN